MFKVDRKYVLRWAHLGLARNPRYRETMEEQHRIAQQHLSEIQDEQERLNVPATVGKGKGLPLAPRYLQGRIPHTQRKGASR
jgi:hypothetical protein